MAFTVLGATTVAEQQQQPQVAAKKGSGVMRRQTPFDLVGYALSIPRCQGMTLDGVMWTRERFRVCAAGAV